MPALATLIAVASAPVLANGLAINEQSASAAGTAYAGRASMASDATTIYGNPAGLSRLDRAQVSVGAAVIMADTEISNVSGGAPGGTNEGDMVPTSVIPFAYYAAPYNDRVSYGLGLYAPFGVESDYEETFAGRRHGLRSKVQVVTLQPTVSFEVTDRIAIGGGLTFNRIDGKLTSAVPLPPVLGGGDVNVDLEGDDMALGFNVGLLVALTDNLDWGITYHSKLDFNLSGNIKISNRPPVPPAVLPIPPNGSYGAELQVTMPESVDTSLTYRLNQWTLSAGVTWTRWSQLQELAVQTQFTSPRFPPIEELKWDDSWAYAVGAAYRLNPQWELRVGYAFDESPTNDEYRTVRIPVSDRNIVTLGAGWSATPNLSIDLAYAYIWEDEGSVSYPAPPVSDGYSATFENTAHAISAQVNYRF